MSSISTLQMPNGAQYTGEVYNGKPYGRGKIVYSNSQRYEGDFLDGMKHGKGKYYYVKGEFYIGDWYENKKHGVGQYFYVNGSFYKGEFADNKKHGKGKFQESNGSYFEGKFKMNNKDSTGVYFDATKCKKYRLAYDNGKLITQEEIPLNDTEANELKKDSDFNSSDFKSEQNGSKRNIVGENNIQRNILSLQNYINESNQPQKVMEYVSMCHPDKKDSFHSSVKSSPLLIQQYLEPKLMNKRVNDWEMEQVSAWLSQIGFGDCIEQFRENNIMGDTLLQLRNEDLKSLNIAALGDRRILKREIDLLGLIFKTQCLGDCIVQYSKNELTLELIRQLEEKKKANGANMDSSSSSSSSEKEKDKKKKSRNVSMQSKVEQFLEKKGIKLTFLIPKEQIEIIEPIGKGGYGQVFLGRWLGQDVAVKKYLKKQGFRNKHIGNFIEEVEVINKLNHPCIVLYMGMCIQDNEYGMVTEFLSGGSLFDCLHKRKEVLTPETILSICQDVALGMAYLHQKNVLHCDLKSSNVLIDENWNVKLCDFGLSRVNSSKNKKKNRAIRVGTPHWMAPEILKGEKYQCHSDVYSYGILLWEMLTGNIPYRNYSTAQIIGLVGNDEDHHISIPDYPNKTLLNIFLRCTERDAKKRPTFKFVVEVLQKNQAVEGK